MVSHFYKENRMVKIKECKKSPEEMDVISIIPDPIIKAPDCVYQTIIKRMSELDKEIRDYEDMLVKLRAEYTAHANFILKSPFGQPNLSQSPVNNEKSPQPSG